MDKVVQLYREWMSLQPLKKEDQDRLDRKFRLEFNFNSNHIEGNTLTYGQTKLLLLFDETTGNARLQDYEEMKAHDVGLKVMKQEALDTERPLTEAFIRELNKIILVRPYWKDARTHSGEPTRMEVKIGTYKTRPNHVLTATGEVFNYATPEETPSLMNELVQWYNDEAVKGELSPLELAALLHYRFIRIHPFEDGNGRIARLLVNYVLIRNNYPPVIIQSKDKENYLRILHQCDIVVGMESASQGAKATLQQIKPFVEYLNTQLEYSLSLSVKAAKGESIEEEADFAKQVALLERQLHAKNGQETSKSANETRKIIELVFLDFKRKLEGKLRMIEVFFTMNNSGCYLFSINGAIGFNESLLTSTNKNEIAYLQNPVKIMYNFKFTNPREVKLGRFAIDETINLVFNNTNYKLDGLDQQFAYGTFPSEQQIDELVATYTNKILKLIEERIANM